MIHARRIAGTLVVIGTVVTALAGTVPSLAASANRDLEQVVVRAERLPVPSRLEVEHTYQAQERGARLFRRGDYGRAYPYLLTAAKRGFKTAQARLAYIYLHGLGEIPYDPVRGIGWLSVAASPETLPWIRRYSKRIWKLVPERYAEDLELVADRYRHKYGREATGVSCNRNKGAGTYQVHLMCLFDDEAMHEDAFDRESLRELWWVGKATDLGLDHAGVMGMQ